MRKGSFPRLTEPALPLSHPAARKRFPATPFSSQMQTHIICRRALMKPMEIQTCLSTVPLRGGLRSPRAAAVARSQLISAAPLPAPDRRRQKRRYRPTSLDRFLFVLPFTRERAFPASGSAALSASSSPLLGALANALGLARRGYEQNRDSIPARSIAIDRHLLRRVEMR